MDADAQPDAGPQGADGGEQYAASNSDAAAATASDDGADAAGSAQADYAAAGVDGADGGGGGGPPATGSLGDALLDVLHPVLGTLCGRLVELQSAQEALVGATRATSADIAATEGSFREARATLDRVPGACRTFRRGWSVTISVARSTRSCRCMRALRPAVPLPLASCFPRHPTTLAEYTARLKALRKAMANAQVLLNKVEKGSAGLRGKLEAKAAERQARRAAEQASYGYSGGGSGGGASSGEPR